MSRIGPVLSRHVNLSLPSAGLIVLGVLFLAVTALLIAVKDQANPEALPLIMNTLLVIGIVGVLALAGGIAMRRRRWEQGEFGVRRMPDDTTWLYKDITETCQFYRHGMPVGLAWRRGSDPQWHAIDARTGGYLKFLKRFMAGYHQARVPVLLEKLESGHTIGFKTMSLGGKLKSIFSLGVKQYADLATDSVKLSRHRIALVDADVQIGSIAEIDVSSWTSRIIFKLRDGSQVAHSYTALFDAELFLILVEALREVHAHDAGVRA
ncbi:hypothetical protein LDO31_18630 [Luteimonas sp. XNQY3]|nr:hypothetical protein [Luteimonas sp. XNQY3]